MIPAGTLVTAPRPTLVTVRANSGTKVAVTLLAAVMLIAQAAVPVQAPLQPVNLEPVVAVAVRATVVPWS